MCNNGNETDTAVSELSFLRTSHCVYPPTFGDEHGEVYTCGTLDDAFFLLDESTLDALEVELVLETRLTALFRWRVSGNMIYNRVFCCNTLDPSSSIQQNTPRRQR
jgi:hypothetical protein